MKNMLRLRVQDCSALELLFKRHSRLVFGITLRILGSITWWHVAEIVGISDWHMRRWRERYDEFAGSRFLRIAFP